MVYMTKMRHIFVLLGLSVWVLIGTSYLLETAVAQTMQPRVYLPIIANGDSSEVGVIGPVYDGSITYYNATGEGNCMFPASPDNLMVAAITHVQYGAADFCGAFVKVNGPKGSVIVRIVDKCPDAGCVYGHLDLSREAFAVIGNISDGIITDGITWQVVSPNMDGPIQFEFKEKNQWWTAVQVRNHRNPIAKFEYLSASGFVEITRTDYNYFLEASGMGPGPYTFRVTDILGNQIVSNGIPLSNPGVEIDGRGQFPSP
jgi:expansin (peptidoglycan-binding protein)